MALNDYMYRYYKAQVDGTSSATEASNDLADGPLLQFERMVQGTYGVTVSIAEKAKAINKFGENESVGTAEETVWHTGGNEVYLTDNLITTISSSSPSDTTTFRIEGHTVSGTGADAQFTFVVQTGTLTGNSQVTLSTPLARVSRYQNTGSVDNVGAIYIYEDDTSTAGVPDTAAKIHLSTDAGYNQSEKCATTFSDNDWFCLTSMSCGVAKKTGANCDFYLEVREVGGVFQPRHKMSATNQSGNVSYEFNPPLVVPKNSDVRIVAESDTTNTSVYATFNGYIAIEV